MKNPLLYRSAWPESSGEANERFLMKTLGRTQSERRTLTKMYGLKVDELLNGRRGRDNEPRKVGMCLIKELCDLKLQEIADHFGTGSYGTVGWACHGVAAKMNSDTKFRDRVTRIRRNCQQKT